METNSQCASPSGEMRMRQRTNLHKFMKVAPDNFVAAQILDYISGDRRIKPGDKRVIIEGFIAMRSLFLWGYEEICANMESGEAPIDGFKPQHLYYSLHRALRQECSYLSKTIKNGAINEINFPYLTACWRAVDRLESYVQLPSSPGEIYESPESMMRGEVESFFNSVFKDVERAYHWGEKTISNIPIEQFARAALFLSDNFLRSPQDSPQSIEFCQAIYNNADFISYAKLLEFSNLCSEYNSEWALAMHEWQ